MRIRGRKGEETEREERERREFVSYLCISVMHDRPISAIDRSRSALCGSLTLTAISPSHCAVSGCSHCPSAEAVLLLKVAHTRLPSVWFRS